jgi:hypothetical protein
MGKRGMGRRGKGEKGSRSYESVHSVLVLV